MPLAAGTRLGVFEYYNFARIHETLRVTPAREACVSDHVCTLAEIAGLLPSPGERKDSMPTTIGAQLPRELLEWLAKFQKESGMNRSQIIRVALRYYRASSGPELVKLKIEVSRLKFKALYPKRRMGGSSTSDRVIG